LHLETGKLHSEFAQIWSRIERARSDLWLILFYTRSFRRLPKSPVDYIDFERADYDIVVFHADGAVFRTSAQKKYEREQNSGNAGGVLGGGN
jgi:hypothetical protein